MGTQIFGLPAPISIFLTVTVFILLSSAADTPASSHCLPFFHFFFIIDHAFPDDLNEHLTAKVKDRIFPLLCNHCTNPPCVRVCPTQATYQMADGIVAMDYHRCIGCRFCMAGCPFGARSFNFMDPRKHLPKEMPNPTFPTRMQGVVEKCTFCAERLAQGLMPACVEAAGGRILFGDLDDPNSDVRRALAENYSIRRKPNLGTQPGVYYLI